MSAADDLGAGRPPSWRSARWPAPRPCRATGRARRTGPCRRRTRLAVDQLDHLRVRPLPGDEPEPGADELQRRVRHRRPADPQQRPRVLPVPPHRHAHRGGRGVVERPEPDPAEQRRDRARCARSAARSPPTATGSRPAATRPPAQRSRAIDHPERLRPPARLQEPARGTPCPRRPAANSGVCQQRRDAAPGSSPPRRRRTGPGRRAARRAPRRGRAPCAMTLASSES